MAIVKKSLAQERDRTVVLLSEDWKIRRVRMSTNFGQMSIATIDVRGVTGQR